MNVSPRSLLVFAGLLMLAGAVRASTPGTDDAANYASSGWTNNSNGGTGFGAWSLSSANNNGSNSGAAGFFLGNSTSLSGGNNGANINSTADTSFGLYANSTLSNNGDVHANAVRGFAAGGLVTGQNFSLDLAVNYRNGNKGVDLRDASNNSIFTFNVGKNDAGNDDYSVSHATTGNGSVGNAYSANTAFHLVFSQMSDTGGTWTITRSGGVTASPISGTYTGDATGFQLYIVGTNQGDENNLFANNLAVTGVPEPATWLGGGLVMAAAGWRLRRPKSRHGLATA